MTQKERLIELLCEVKCEGLDRREGGCGFRQYGKCNRIDKLDMCMLANIAEWLLENGVIVPMFKVGDKVYTVLDDESIEERYFIAEETVAEVGVNGVWLDACYTPKGMIGDYIPYEKLFETWHMNYEQAEKALAERMGK